MASPTTLQYHAAALKRHQQDSRGHGSYNYHSHARGAVRQQSLQQLEVRTQPVAPRMSKMDPFFSQASSRPTRSECQANTVTGGALTNVSNINMSSAKPVVLAQSYSESGYRALQSIPAPQQQRPQAYEVYDKEPSRPRRLFCCLPRRRPKSDLTSLDPSSAPRPALKSIRRIDVQAANASRNVPRAYRARISLSPEISKDSKEEYQGKPGKPTHHRLHLGDNEEVSELKPNNALGPIHEVAPLVIIRKESRSEFNSLHPLTCQQRRQQNQLDHSACGNPCPNPLISRTRTGRRGLPLGQLTNPRRPAPNQTLLATLTARAESRRSPKRIVADEKSQCGSCEFDLDTKLSEEDVINNPSMSGERSPTSDFHSGLSLKADTPQQPRAHFSDATSSATASFTEESPISAIVYFPKSTITPPQQDLQRLESRARKAKPQVVKYIPGSPSLTHLQACSSIVGSISDCSGSFRDSTYTTCTKSSECKPSSTLSAHISLGDNLLKGMRPLLNLEKSSEDSDDDISPTTSVPTPWSENWSIYDLYLSISREM
ncbi:hypothetical protein BDZ91DRAFT_853573 [Kalaharituber pfeilii]|nr:hypothetical protein BDZ91DRAFT_853573 [Kalaharituber pfeilii]